MPFQMPYRATTGSADHFNVSPNRLGYDPSQPHRDGIPYVLRKPLRRNFGCWVVKLVILRKRLEKCGFAQRNSAILLRVTKPAVADPAAVSGQSWCKPIPRHSPVDCLVPFPTRFLVTLQAK